MTATSKQQQFSQFNTFWLIVRKEYIYMDVSRSPRGLNFSKVVEKELQKRGFVQINKYWCKPYRDSFSLAADRLLLHSFISLNEHRGPRQVASLFYISDKQFGMCVNSDYYSVATKYQKENAIIL